MDILFRRIGLTKQEQVVLTWLLEGKENKGIAAVLGISPRTVQKHLQRIYQKLGVQSRTEAIVQVYRDSQHEVRQTECRPETTLDCPVDERY